MKISHLIAEFLSFEKGHAAAYLSVIDIRYQTKSRSYPMFARSFAIPTRREMDSSNSWSALSLLFRWLTGSKAS
jgi:hypothetical protein